MSVLPAPVWMALAAVAGASVGLRAGPWTNVDMLLAAAVAAVAAVLSFWHRSRPGARGPWFRAGLLLAALALATALHATLSLDAVLAERSRAWPAPVLEVQGRVADLVREQAPRIRLVLDAVEPHHRGSRLRALDGRLEVYAAKEAFVGALPRAGERWRLRVELRRASGRMNPGGFDAEGWRVRAGVVASGRVLPHPRNARLATAPAWSAQGMRAALADHIREALGDTPSAGIVRALLVGDRRGIDEATWADLRATGTAHLVAISGLHVALVAGAALALCRLVRRRTARRGGAGVDGGWAAFAAFAAACGYAMLAGFTLPTQRALVMLAVALLITRLGRRTGVLDGLGIAALVVVGLDPFAVEAPGFWMSFLAVAVLLLAARPVTVGAAPVGAVRAAMTRFSAAQWALLAGLGPFALLAVGAQSLLAPFANLVAVPVVAFAVLPLDFAGAAFAALGIDALAGLAWALAAAVMEPLLGALALLARAASVLPFGLLESETSVDATGLAWRCAVAALAAGWLLFARGLLSRWVVGPLLLVPVAFASTGPATGGVRVTMLDVGQGLAVLARTENHALLFDAGPRSTGGYDAGARVVVPALRALGVRRLDALVVSHADLDHLGGARAVADTFAPPLLLAGADVTPSDLGPHGDRVRPCVAGTSWQFDDVEFRVSYPVAVTSPLGRNDRSCVIEVRIGAGSVWLFGDIESAGEARLLASGAVSPGRRVPLMTAPHHGARGSSTPALLDALAPRHVLISAGARNAYGQPHAQTVDRYLLRGVQIWCTGRDGAIDARIDKHGALRSIDGWRSLHGRRWHRLAPDSGCASGELDWPSAP